MYYLTLLFSMLIGLINSCLMIVKVVVDSLEEATYRAIVYLERKL